MMDASLKVTLIELNKYDSDLIWSTKVKTRSKFDSLKVLGEGNAFVIYWKVCFLVISLQNLL